MKNEKKWRNTSEVPLFQKRTKWFWSWVNYVWLHLHSSLKRVIRLLWLCVYYENQKQIISHSVTRWLWLYSSLPRMLQMYPNSHSNFMSIDKPNVVLKRFFWKFSERTLFNTHLWLLLMSAFRILRSQKHQSLRQYRVSPLWRKGFKKGN